MDASGKDDIFMKPSAAARPRSHRHRRDTIVLVLMPGSGISIMR